MPKHDDVYHGRPQETKQLLGVVAYSEMRKAEFLSEDRVEQLDQVSEALQGKIAKACAEFLAEHPELTFSEKTFVTLDSCAAYMASWSCSEETIKRSTTEVTSSLMFAANLIQHHYSDKQKRVYNYVGGYSH